MKIGLDYDKTYNLDPDFWSIFADMVGARGHEVRIITARSPYLDRLSEDQVESKALRDTAIYCDGVAKRFVCTHFADDYKGWIPDVWIDDKPETVDNNSTATQEVLKEWRASEEYRK